MATKAVTKAKTTALAPEDMFAPEDFSLGIEQEDIQIPSIILLQSLTELSELEERPWKKGQFYDMSTDEVLNNFEGLVIGYYPTVKQEGPKKPNGRRDVVRFSSDGRHWDDSGDRINPSEFRYNPDGTFAKKVYHYLILRKGSDFPVMLTFKGASAKHARKLNSHLARMIPSWRHSFKFRSVEEESDGNRFYVITPLPAPKAVPNATTAQLAREFYDMMQSSRIANDEMAPSADDNLTDPAY